MDSRVYSVEEVRVEGLDVVAGAPLAITVSACGKVNSTGWTNPRLNPWIYIVPPKDGILDLDFTATAPTGYVLFVISPICAGLVFPVPHWVCGVRVHTSTNSMEAKFNRPKEVVDQDFRGLPGPWPFPWHAPSATK